MFSGSAREHLPSEISIELMNGLRVKDKRLKFGFGEEGDFGFLIMTWGAHHFIMMNLNEHEGVIKEILIDLLSFFQSESERVKMIL
jgi:hypothetical protein